MSDINLDYFLVGTTIQRITEEIRERQGELDEIYSEIVNAMEGYKGEEAVALGRMREQEQQLITEVCTLLNKYAESVDFIVDEFRKLDEDSVLKLKL